MTSTFANAQPAFHYHHTSPDHRPYYDSYLPPTPQSTLPTDLGYCNGYDTAAIVADTLSLLQQPASFCSHAHTAFGTSNPTFRLQNSTPTPVPPASDCRQDSVLPSTDAPVWQQAHMYGIGMGAPVPAQGHKRARSHQRTPSASTIASNGPASPFTHTAPHPQIANTDFSPSSPAQYSADPSGTAFFSKHLNLPTPSHTPTDSTFAFNAAGYMPSQVAHLSSAHQAMKTFAIDHHHNSEDFAPEYTHSSRQSMSSYNGNDSPATPQSAAGEIAHNGQYSMPTNDYRQINPNVQLFRTESQAYQDELYNPPTSYNAAPTSSAKAAPAANNFLSPHRNLVTERLQTANNARSHSPVSAMSRERSPFRDGSPLAPASGWRSPGPGVGTAAGMRQHQKEQAEQAELAQHRPQLQREPTKTISPKDALLDYNEPEQPSLFQDSIPAGYKHHTGGTEQWPSNTFVSQPGTTFGNLITPSQQTFTNFRATSAEGYSTSDALGYAALPPQDQGQVHNAGSYLGGGYSNLGHNKMDSSHLDANPPFPANLTSMESSISDNGPPASSQESAVNNTSAPHRPADTRAASGTYTCTYHGCTQRFDSPANLQKHKRDFHRSQQQQARDTSATSSATASASPRSSESPAPSTAGMTSATIMARNSQAGPHKCTRINPSTNKPCNTIFSRPYDLTRHEDTIHNNRKQKVRCPMCREEKTFSRNDALTRHMRVVHPEVEAYGKRGRRGD